ncbi:60S ribosomal protein L8-like [Papaver somniferum]|uniref:60S ribosomal protein L8-like n=1 Tax=Papaver somniferum TaxID=3469 RepID=UPI000E6FB356|nr:60S ribosomal protein L8-like [Papaver somniferum]
MVAQVAGGSKTENPMLEAGNADHKYKVKRNRGPRIRGVAVAKRSKKRKSKKVRGGNHQHIGHVSTVCGAPTPGFKTGLIAKRRTGRLRGQLDAATAAKADEA